MPEQHQGGRGSDAPAGAAADLPPVARPKRRARGFEPAGTTLTAPATAGRDAGRGTLAGTVERYGFADPRVLLRWREIVGEDLADRCRPLKVLHGKGRDLAARLLVSAEGAAALEVEYRAPQILDRVNAVYGYRHVSRLSITQVSSLDAAPEAAPMAAATPAVSAEAAHQAERSAGEIDDVRLREAMSRLGTYVLSDPREDD
ncbi:MAG: DciA family protein [Pseudomonadota bacterium]